jgi:DNA repair protein RecO (recombination protein O)
MSRAFILHNRNYRESSALVSLLTDGAGRISVVARGVRKKSSNKGALPGMFTRFDYEVRGRGDLKTLIRWEPDDHGSSLSGRQLFVAMYINELIYKVLPEYLPVPGLFELYGAVIEELGESEDVEPLLRNFEMDFLDLMGYSIPFVEIDSSGYEQEGDFELSCQYEFVLNAGFVRSGGARHGEGGVILDGGVIRALMERDFSGKDVRTGAKKLMRTNIDWLLDGKTIESRNLFS